MATGAQANTLLDNGQLPRLEIHDASRPYRFEDRAAAQLRTDLALAAVESGYRRFTGVSTVRRLAEGSVFTLTQHDAYLGDEARFKVLAVDHQGANNLGASAAELLGNTEIEAGSYRNTLTAQPNSIPVVSAGLTKPLAQPQMALVVGLPDQVITTDRDHRIKIQFPWQRGATPNAGGLSDTGAAGRTAGKSGSICWLKANSSVKV